MSNRLQELRRARGLSQDGLARLAGVPNGTIKNIEQGLRVPRLDTAAKLAKALGASLNELAGLTTPPEGK
jgi:transcriptional regulator with XRE-family HTH domain